LRRLLDLTAEQARPPQATQTGLVLGRPGPVAAASPAADKARFFRRIFASRTDVYATRWENWRTGRSGWVPAVEGGWRKGTTKPYLRLTDAVVEAHLTGEVHADQGIILFVDQRRAFSASPDAALEPRCRPAPRSALPESRAPARFDARPSATAHNWRGQTRWPLSCRTTTTATWM
jgi:hypothetical protein